MMHATGYSAPNSAGNSLNIWSNTDTSGIEPVEPPAKRVDQHVPAAPAITAQVATITPTRVNLVHSSSSSDLRSVAASSERRCRLGLARAKQETARGQVELAQANQQVAESELEEALATSITGSVGRIADLESSSGNSARVRPRSDAGAAAPQRQLQNLQQGEERLPAQVPQADALGSPAKARGCSTTCEGRGTLTKGEHPVSTTRCPT